MMNRELLFIGGYLMKTDVLQVCYEPGSDDKVVIVWIAVCVASLWPCAIYSEAGEPWKWKCLSDSPCKKWPALSYRAVIDSQDLSHGLAYWCGQGLGLWTH